MLTLKTQKSEAHKNEIKQYNNENNVQSGKMQIAVKRVSIYKVTTAASSTCVPPLLIYIHSFIVCRTLTERLGRTNSLTWQSASYLLAIGTTCQLLVIGPLSLLTSRPVRILVLAIPKWIPIIIFI